MTSPMPDTSEDTWAGIDSPMWKALADVEAERFRQNKKWGEQHHPDIDFRHSLNDHAYYDREALAEGDPVKLRAELVQVAAVAVAWIEDIDSRVRVENVSD